MIPTGTRPPQRPRYAPAVSLDVSLVSGPVGGATLPGYAYGPRLRQFAIALGKHTALLVLVIVYHTALICPSTYSRFHFQRIQLQMRNVRIVMNS